MKLKKWIIPIGNVLNSILHTVVANRPTLLSDDMQSLMTRKGGQCRMQSQCMSVWVYVLIRTDGECHK